MAAIFTRRCLAFILHVAAAGVVVLARIGDWTACLGLPSRMIAKVVLGRDRKIASESQSIPARVSGRFGLVVLVAMIVLQMNG